MTKLGIILVWSSTRNEEDLKKNLIKEYTSQYKTLEDFLEDNLRPCKKIQGYDYIE